MALADELKKLKEFFTGENRKSFDEKNLGKQLTSKEQMLSNPMMQSTQNFLTGGSLGSWFRDKVGLPNNYGAPQPINDRGVFNSNAYNSDNSKKTVVINAGSANAQQVIDLTKQQLEAGN